MKWENQLTEIVLTAGVGAAGAHLRFGRRETPGRLRLKLLQRPARGATGGARGVSGSGNGSGGGGRGGGREVGGGSGGHVRGDVTGPFLLLLPERVRSEEAGLDYFAHGLRPRGFLGFGRRRQGR